MTDMGDFDDRCEGIENFDREEDAFVRIGPADVRAINRDPGSPFKIPPAAREAYVNRNPDSPRLAYWVYDSGNVGRAFSPEYRACRGGKKHDRVHELVESYGELLETYEGCMSKGGADGELCGIIYVIARTGQRVGSSDDSVSEQYLYARDPSGRPRRVVTGRVRTYGISTLRAKHVAVVGDRVMLHFTGKSGQQHDIVIDNAAMSDFFRRLLAGKRPDDHVFTPGIYRSVYCKFKSDTGHAIKDLRTAMAHLIVPEAKKEWVREHGEPTGKAQENKMMRYALCRAAAILGNKPGVIRKSYANPSDLLARR